MYGKTLKCDSLIMLIQVFRILFLWSCVFRHLFVGWSKKRRVVFLVSFEVKLLCPIRMSISKLYIFDIWYLVPMLYVYRFLLPLRLGWLLVCCLYKEVYLQVFKCVSFWLRGCCGKWEGWARKPVNPTSWVAVDTPTDRPKSVCNRCVIKLFCGVVCVVTLPFWHFCWRWGICQRTESDLFLFLFEVLLTSSFLIIFIPII